MFVYILMILFSTFCIGISEIYEKKNKKMLRNLFIIIGLSIPIFMAACRKIGVGTDTKAYISLDFYNAIKFDNFFDLYRYSENEFLYLLINFIVSRFTSNVQVLFGVMQTIVISLMYMIAKKQKEKAPVWFTYMLIMLLYYNKSLNMLRQLISCLIVLYAFPFLEEKKFKTYFVWILIGLGFHITAITGIAIYCVYIFTKNKTINFYFIIIALILVLLNYTNIITLVVNIGILDAKYLNYISTDKINASSTELIIKTGMLMLTLIFSKGLCKKDKKNVFFIYMIVIDWIFYFLGNFSNYAERFSYYFGVFQIMNLIQIPHLGKDKDDVIALKWIIAFSVICYSYLMYGILKLDETVPYVLYFK